jgi:hypothetical protein
LTRKDDTEEGPNEELVDTTTRATAADSRTEITVGAKACSLCGVIFHTVEDQRSHTRSDLHGYNLKQKIRGVKPVSEADFEKLVGGEISFFSFFGHLLISPRSRRKSFRF